MAIPASTDEWRVAVLVHGIQICALSQEPKNHVKIAVSGILNQFFIWPEFHRTKSGCLFQTRKSFGKFFKDKERARRSMEAELGPLRVERGLHDPKLLESWLGQVRSLAQYMERVVHI